MLVGSAPFLSSRISAAYGMREGIMYVIAWCTLGVYPLFLSFPFTFRISSEPYVIFRIFYIDISVNDYLIVESDHRTGSIIHVYLPLRIKQEGFCSYFPHPP